MRISRGGFSLWYDLSMTSGDKGVELLIKNEMVDAGIVMEDGQTLSYFLGEREYLVSVIAMDITDWKEER